MREWMLAGLMALPLLAWAQPATAPAGGSAPQSRRAPAATAPAGDAPAPATRPARQPTPAQAAQQQRMRDCNIEARNRNLTGTARSAFMRPCLGGNMPTAGAS